MREGGGGKGQAEGHGQASKEDVEEEKGDAIDVETAQGCGEGDEVEVREED